MNYLRLAFILCSVSFVYWFIIAQTRSGYAWLLAFPMLEEEKPAKTILPGFGCVILISWSLVVIIIGLLWLIKR